MKALIFIAASRLRAQCNNFRFILQGNVCITLSEFLDFADTFLADQSIEEEVKELFQLMDTDAEFGAEDDNGGDGNVTAEEFRNFMHRYAGDVTDITDEGIYVPRLEASCAALTRALGCTADLDDIMREIDEDGQGSISEDELREFLEKLQD